MPASRALTKFWKSGSGGLGSQIYVSNKAIKEEMVASIVLANSWKSRSGGLDPHIDVPSGRINNEMVASRA